MLLLENLIKYMLRTAIPTLPQHEVRDSDLPNPDWNECTLLAGARTAIDDVISHLRSKTLLDFPGTSSLMVDLSLHVERVVESGSVDTHTQSNIHKYSRSAQTQTGVLGIVLLADEAVKSSGQQRTARERGSQSS